MKSITMNVMILDDHEALNRVARTKVSRADLVITLDGLVRKSRYTKTHRDGPPPSDQGSYGHALRITKTGKRAMRTCWKDGEFIVMMDELRLPPYNTQGTERKVNDRTAKYIGEGSPLFVPRYLCKTVLDEDGNISWCCGYTPTQEDMAEEDWVEI